MAIIHHNEGMEFSAYINLENKVSMTELYTVYYIKAETNLIIDLKCQKFTIH